MIKYGNGRLFVSYSYIGSEGNNIIQGFSNMVCDYPRMQKDHIEMLERRCSRDCMAKFGFSAATANIINWKWMEGEQ